MDSVTQFMLGAFVGEKVLGKELGKKSLIYGGIVATLPDLDVFFKSFFNDPLDMFLWHRSVTHSLLFAILFPLLFVFLFQKNYFLRKYKNSITSFKLYNFFFWCLFTHSLLDCFTNWGTQLFYPYPYRIKIASIFIIDLFYTLPFIIVFVWIFISKNQNLQTRSKMVTYTLVVTSIYLIVGVFNKFTIENKVASLLQKKNISYNHVYSHNTPFNIIYWDVVYTLDNKIYASKLSIFDNININNFKLIAQSNSSLPDYFYQHKKSHEFLQLLGDTYAVSCKQNVYQIDDYRFNFFYDHQANKYCSTFSFYIAKNSDNTLSFQCKANLKSIIKNNKLKELFYQKQP